MNERDKGLAKQAWTENDWDGHVDIPKLIQLVRADEREACEMAVEELMPDASRGECAAAIRARENT